MAKWKEGDVPKFKIGDKLKLKKGKKISTVSFVQTYKSDYFKAVGIKELILKREGTRWKIYRENWKKR